ncbi:MAG TPA: VanZ family protein [Clostridiales bacterium]|nr:VanZ family protein [Clostridiales bacterium]
MRKKGQTYLTACLFTIYLLILLWVIIFKLNFSIDDIPYYRSLNLIPLQGSAYGQISAEVKSNVFIFIPFGIYLTMLKGNWCFLKKALTMAGVSLTFEVTQYVLAIGAADITDVIGNTLGGILGIVIYAVFSAAFKTKTNAVLNSLALITTLSGAALLWLLWIYPG